MSFKYKVSSTMLIVPHRSHSIALNEVSEDMVKKYTGKLNRLSSITSYIRDNYQKELSLEYIAEIFGYSPTYLSKNVSEVCKDQL